MSKGGFGSSRCLGHGKSLYLLFILFRRAGRLLDRNDTINLLKIWMTAVGSPKGRHPKFLLAPGKKPTYFGFELGFELEFCELTLAVASGTRICTLNNTSAGQDRLRAALV